MRKLHAHSLRTTRKHTQALQPPDINTTQAVRCLPTNARPQLVSRQPQRYCNRPSSARNPCGRTSHNKCASTTGQRATCTQCQCNRSKSAHNPGSASPLSQNRSTTSQHATHHQGYCNRPSSARNPCSGTPHNKMCIHCWSAHNLHTEAMQPLDVSTQPWRRVAPHIVHICTNCCGMHIQALGVMIYAPRHAETPPPQN